MANFGGMIQLKPYTAINASAGSGKTYTLVQKILLICLSQPYRPDDIRQILALTFTNKAANEMKARILQWLKSFTESGYENNNELAGIREQLEKAGTNVSLKELHERSCKVLDYILHHYSTLNISTIDKFNSRLIRSFSYELGLPHQFNIEIQNEPYLIEAVDRLMESVGEDQKISNAFIDLADYNLENDQKENIAQTLYSKAKEYLSDVHYTELKKNSAFDWESYEKLKNILRRKISESRKNAENIARETLDAVRSSGLTENDFYGKSNSIVAFFTKFLENGKPTLPTHEESSLEKYRKGTTSKDPVIRNTVMNMTDDLIGRRAKIIHLYIESVKSEKFLKELLPFKFNKEIQDQLKMIEEENDLVLLSRFNILINENLRNEPSAFLYEKIGTRFRHFFIDEFQDTSLMQWQNMIPLKDNAVSQEDNSFTLVGDPKQSIYRFRGGESSIMLDILNGKETSSVPVEVEILTQNYRSARNIVDFNNRLYEFLGQNLSEEHRKLFAEDAHQNAVAQNPGRVHISLTEHTRAIAFFFENSAEQMHRNIQQCLENGFSLSDITILCRDSKQIRNYASLLGQKKIFYQNREQYIRTLSDKGITLEISITLNAVIEYLKWELEPENYQHTVRFLYYLNELGRIRTDDFSELAIELLALHSKYKTEKKLKEKFGLKLDRENAHQLNLYNFIEYYTEEFSVAGKETEFILNFLESAYNFTQNPGAGLKDFVRYWDEEAHKQTVLASENIDAVRLMTIHSSKGLEFPVVFLPVTPVSNRKKTREWFALSDSEALKSINIENFSDAYIPFDEDIRIFNENNSYREYIDQLCVSYVATTRAAEQLYLYMQRPSKTGTPTSIYQYLQRHAPEKLKEDEFDLYPETGEALRKQHPKEKKTLTAWSISRLYPEERNPGNITIATPSKSYQNTVAHVRTGILAHEILSKVATGDDLPKILQTYLLNGTITEQEKTEINDRICRVIYSEEYAPYFRRGLSVFSEKDIMVSESGEIKTYRPDRIVETRRGLVVIDFKTGQKKPEHQEQIAHYRSILEKRGKTVAATHLIYI